MNDFESLYIRILQYLLAKDVFLQEQKYAKEKSLYRKNPHPDDIFDYWVAHIKYECWQEISGDVWKLLK